MHCGIEFPVTFILEFVTEGNQKKYLHSWERLIHKPYLHSTCVSFWKLSMKKEPLEHKKR